MEGFCDGLDFGEGVLGAAEGGVLGEEGVLVIAEDFMGEVSSSDDFVLGENRITLNPLVNAGWLGFLSLLF